MGGCGPPKTGLCLPSRCSTPAACPDFIPGFGKECATCWVVPITRHTTHKADVILRCNIHCITLFLDQRVSGPCAHTTADEDRLPIARADPPGTRLIQNSHSPVPWYNADSQVLNEAALVEAMRAFVASRGVPGEELVVFDHTQFPGFLATRDFFNHQVKAVIGTRTRTTAHVHVHAQLWCTLISAPTSYIRQKGPHGGAFYNINFSPRDTLVVEFFPVKPRVKTALRWPEGTWWQAACLQVRRSTHPLALANLTNCWLTRTHTHPKPHAHATSTTTT
jgi:hypothetical protein